MCAGHYRDLGISSRKTHDSAGKLIRSVVTCRWASRKQNMPRSGATQAAFFVNNNGVRPRVAAVFATLKPIHGLFKLFPHHTAEASEHARMYLNMWSMHYDSQCSKPIECTCGPEAVSSDSTRASAETPSGRHFVR